MYPATVTEMMVSSLAIVFCRMTWDTAAVSMFVSMFVCMDSQMESQILQT